MLFYEPHYGLSGRPFADRLDPSAFVPLPSHEAVVRRLRYGLEHGQGPALLFGPTGAGKTLLAGVLSRELGSGTTTVHIPYPALPASELLTYLAEEIEGRREEAHPSLHTSLRRVQNALQTASARGQRPLLIVDEAHLIEDPATFEALRLLLNFRSKGESDLSLLLVGDTEVLLNLSPALADRLTARCLLGPLTEAESSDFVLGRLAAAGATRPLFDPRTLALLHQASDGLPRRLCRLADLALLIAYARELDQPDEHAVVAAIREVFPEPSAA